MNRRSVLASTAALSVGLTGCSLSPTGSADDPPTLPDGLSVETRRWSGCVLTETPICAPENRKAYNTIVTDEETALSRLSENSIAEFDRDEFVEATDFSQSYLVLVQYRMQEAPRLRLDAMERTDAGLWVDVEVERPDGSYGDVSVPHTLVIRITDEQAPTPGTIRVSVHEEGDRTDHTGTVTPSR